MGLVVGTRMRVSGTVSISWLGGGTERSDIAVGELGR